MKKALLFVSIFAILFAVACTSKTADQAQQPVADTTGLAAFQEWKFQNELKASNEYMQETAVATAPVKTVKKKVAAKKPKPVVTPAPEQTEQDNNGTVNETPSQDQTGTIGTETTNEAKEKKGISNAVKGTVIGAVSGAVLGAVINKKNRVVGGVIGGVLGGGVGFGIGKKIDKNEGR